LSFAESHKKQLTIVADENALARALRDVNLVSLRKFTLKPEQESVVTALLARRAVSSTCACRIRGNSILSKASSCWEL